MSPNRAILLTPAGGAAIAVVRIQGPRVLPFLSRHFSHPVAPMRCVHGQLRAIDGEVIDDPVVVVHEGHLAADLNLHGGPWVVASVLELLRDKGFEVIPSSAGAIPIELADGETLLEREVSTWLPLATTEPGLRMLLAQPAAWEAFVASKPACDAIARILEDRCLDRLLHPPRVAIIGAPNVGKSTLANQLFARQRSITADLPGTTRDWVGEIANIDGLPVLLVDTPGVRESNDAIEQSAIGRSREVIAQADLVIVVIDASQPRPEPDPLMRAHPDALVVLNKTDRRLSAMDDPPDHIETIATTGHGVAALRDAIRRWLGCSDLFPHHPRWWTPRQQEILRRACDNPGKLIRLITPSARCPDT